MIIYWEDIRWDVDDAGTSRATLADEEHNSLTLESRDGKITFQTDGSPRFDASTVLDVTVLCMVMSKDAMGQPGGARQGRIIASMSQPSDADAVIPEQRHAPDPDTGATEPEASPLTQAEHVGQCRGGQAGRRSLAGLTS